jgi:hypothetical protein
MGPIQSWEANSCWASKEIASVVLNLKVNFCQRRPLLVPTHSHLSPSCFTCILYYHSIYSYVGSVGLFNGSPPKVFQNQFLFSFLQGTYSTHVIFLDLIILIICGEGYKLRRSSLCSFFIIPCGGGIEYLHRSPASRKRQRKANPVPRAISRPPCSWGI